jgi:hypothetical protein
MFNNYELITEANKTLNMIMMKMFDLSRILIIRYLEYEVLMRVLSTTMI